MSGCSARFPPMWPEFESYTRCNKRVKVLLVSSRLWVCRSEEFCPGSPIFTPPKKTMDDQPLRGITNVSIYLQGFCSLHELNLGNTSNYWWMHTKDSRASKRTPVAMYQLCGRGLVYGLNSINFPTYLKMHFVKQISFHNVNE